MAVKGCRKTATYVTRIRSRHIGNFYNITHNNIQGLVRSITIPIALLILLHAL